MGVPYRNLSEEDPDKRAKIEPYLQAVETAGGEAVPISLRTSPEELAQLAASLDAFLLPGSPSDVEPALYHAVRHPRTADADASRERTDWFLLDHSFAEHKPVLAICYGVQLLNVYCGGTLVQDIASELGSRIPHEWTGKKSGAPEPTHRVHFAAGSRLAELAGQAEAEVNSSHHQSVQAAAKNLSITAHAPDGVVEAVEWAGDSNWVVGVQWHPERMTDDSLARALFKQLVEQARAKKKTSRHEIADGIKARSTR